MKKIFNILILTLALNFLAIGGAVGYLFQTKHLDKSKLVALRDVVFPTTQPSSTTQPSETPAKEQNSRLTNLLASQKGKPAIEQVDFIRRTIDGQMLILDRRERELADLERQVNLANQKLAADRAALDKRDKDLAVREQESQRLQDDAGFQNTLSLYGAMAPKQVKSIFMTLSDQTVQQYIQAMDTRTAGKIIKEFKTPDETAFIQKILERIRQDQVSSAVGKQPQP